MNLENPDHFGRCSACSIKVRCEEGECWDEAGRFIGDDGHDYWCERHLQEAINRPDPFDLACEQRYD